MESIKRFNGLNGATVSREELLQLLYLAEKEEQFHISQKLNTILLKNSDSVFCFDIESPAFESTPKSMLNGLQILEESEDVFGLGKAVSSNDVYDMITNLVMNTIKKVGHLPWQKEWQGSGGKQARNYVTKKPYSGINFMLLNFDVLFDENDEPYLVPVEFENPYYLTFNQIKEAKATLKKGSKARNVIYYTPLFVYDDGNTKIKTSDKVKYSAFIKENGIDPADLKFYASQIPIVKYYNVYKADDCTGLKFPAVKEKETTPIESAQAIIDHYPNPPKYTFIGTDAKYTPSLDEVNMPSIKAFTQESFYYSTYFHEIIHSTGHSKRLDRGNDTRKRDGSIEDKKAYAFEELVAELGAVFLCSESGILFHTIENSAKYLNGWNKRLLSYLQEDNKMFFKASAQAQKASNWILDLDADDVPAYLKNQSKSNDQELTKKGAKKSVAKKVKPAKTTVEPKPNVQEKTKKTEKVVGYMLVDNISGEMVASKKSLLDLESVFLNIEQNNALSDSDVFVYEIISKAGKNVQGKRVSVNWHKKIDKNGQIALFGAKKGLNSPFVEDAEVTTKETVLEEISDPVKTEPTVLAKEEKPISKNPNVQKIGTSSNAAPSEFYTIDGEIAKYFQQVEKKPVHSVVITLDGPQGAGKTTMLYQIMDAFASPGNKCLFISGEEHPTSSLAIEKTIKYLSQAAQANIDAIGEVQNTEELYSLIELYDIIFIDSWQKLLRMVGTIQLDEDLRKRFHGKVFVIIFQQTTTGRTKGGAEVVFDGDIITKLVKMPRFSENYSYFDKNRYTQVPLETIRYNVASGKVYNPEKPEPSEPPKLSFTAIEI
ncbi:zincin-like metallopeptidase domain-containing protein [Flavobacterium sp. PLA-1-15]|uniref:zincin-like metallopeptidase domain-containing protein n=1 Tax=Flavobacterium sp. PLA-1-15 TaxID=3380533 RepID=UPI003B7FA774